MNRATALAAFCVILSALYTPAGAFMAEPSAALVSSHHVVIDVRGLDEFKKEHIKGAIHLPPDFLAQCVREGRYIDFHAFLCSVGVSPGKTVLLCPADGAQGMIRAGAAAFLIAYSGAKDVHILQGGVGAWRRRGLPLSSTGAELISLFWPMQPDGGMMVQPGETEKRDRLKQGYAVEILPLPAGPSPAGARNTLAAAALFNDGQPLPPDRLKRMLSDLNPQAERDLILYPGTREESLFAAWLLTRHAGVHRVRIVKGEKLPWIDGKGSGKKAR